MKHSTCIAALLVTCVATLGLAACSGWAPAAAQEPTTQPTPAQPVAPIDGSRLFQRRCAACHGALGKGDGPASMMQPADLTQPALQQRLSDADLAGVMRQGKGKMPPVSGLTDEEVAALTAFVRSLGAPK